MRCLASLAEWQKLSALCRIEWRRSEPHLRKEMALLAAHAVRGRRERGNGGAVHALAGRRREPRRPCMFVAKAAPGCQSRSAGPWVRLAFVFSPSNLRTPPPPSPTKAWHMNEWDEMALYVETVDAPATHHPTAHATNHHNAPGGTAGAGAGAAAAAALHAAAGVGGAAGGGSGGGHTATGAFLRAVLSVRHASYDVAQAHIERARGEPQPRPRRALARLAGAPSRSPRLRCACEARRPSWWPSVLLTLTAPCLLSPTTAELMSTDLAALVGESYERAYTDMVGAGAAGPTRHRWMLQTARSVVEGWKEAGRCSSRSPLSGAQD